MPDESCRKCGGILLKCSLCAECKKITQQICQICRSKNEEKFHYDCFYNIEPIKTMTSHSKISIYYIQKN